MTKEEHIKIMEAASKIMLFSSAIQMLIPNVCTNCSHLLSEIQEGLSCAADDILKADNDRLFSMGQTSIKVQ